MGGGGRLAQITGRETLEDGTDYGKTTYREGLGVAPGEAWHYHHFPYGGN